MKKITLCFGVTNCGALFLNNLMKKKTIKYFVIALLLLFACYLLKDNIQPAVDKIVDFAEKHEDRKREGVKKWKAKIDSKIEDRKKEREASK